jgi:glycosyltransferase involved in cell wall biosynthesis
VRELGLTSRVIFTDGSADVAERLAQAQLFVLSSRSEGFPLSVLEAMRAGLPVVGSDIGGVREAVAHGETGYLVSPGDVPEMAAVLSDLLSNGPLRASLGRAGRRRYEIHFTFDQMLGQTLSLYHSVVAGSSTRRAYRAATARERSRVANDPEERTGLL